MYVRSQISSQIGAQIMAEYSKERNYDNQITLNATRKDYTCPCCGKSFLLTEVRLERFELNREIVLRPSFGYRVRYGAYRVCPICDKKRNFSILFPINFTKGYIIIAIITSIIACCINFDKYGTVTMGAWLGFATPVLGLVWILPTLVMYKITKKIDFDKALSNNAVDWFPIFENENK